MGFQALNATEVPAKQADRFDLVGVRKLEFYEDDDGRTSVRVVVQKYSSTTGAWSEQTGDTLELSDPNFRQTILDHQATLYPLLAAFKTSLDGMVKEVMHIRGVSL